MNLRHIEVFHAIMQTGSVTGAAQLLNVTQPAISNLLRHAEQQIKFKLFERVGGRLQPTAEAAYLFPEVQEIFSRLNTFKETLNEVRNGRYGSLAIAASPTVVNAYLPKAVAQLRRQAPGAQITVHSLPTAKAIEERVSQRGADIGIVYAPVGDAGVAFEEVTRSPVICALPHRSPLTERDVVETEDLASTTVVTTGATSRVGAAIMEAYASRGLPMPVSSIEVNSLQVACLMAAEGIGVGLVDTATVHQYSRSDVEFRPFRPHIELSTCLIYPKNRSRSALSKHFGDCLRTLFHPCADTVAPDMMALNR